MPEGADERDMLAFETLTLVPIDRRMIVADMLPEDERLWLDAYHAEVAARVGPPAGGRGRGLAGARDAAARGPPGRPRGGALTPARDREVPMPDTIAISPAEGTWVVRAGGAVLGESSRALELARARPRPGDLRAQGGRRDGVPGLLGQGHALPPTRVTPATTRS